MLRPLVNQPDIILFMATFGLTYFLIGFGETRVRRRAEGDDHRSSFTCPRARSTCKMLGGLVSLQKIDIAAAVIASIMVAGLAVFFQQDPHRPGHLRAVADSHKAALSVGISPDQIWVMVWFAAGVGRAG